jgi:hypothetical protein
MAKRLLLIQITIMVAMWLLWPAPAHAQEPVCETDGGPLSLSVVSDGYVYVDNYNFSVTDPNNAGAVDSAYAVLTDNGGDFWGGRQWGGPCIVYDLGATITGTLAFTAAGYLSNGNAWVGFFAYTGQSSSIS